MNTILTIDTNALVHNLDVIKKKHPNCKILAYLKQNAYSLNDEVISSALCQADGFGVTDFNAALKLRSIYADKVILNASSPPTFKALKKASQEEITVVIYSKTMVDLVVKHRIKGRYWIKVNTGFNRLGLAPNDLNYAVKEISKYSKSTPVLMTHFMDQSIQSPILQKQMQLWQTITDSYSLPISHVRTCTLMNDVNPVGDWLRPGMMLYGLPSHSQWQLKQAITLKAPVYQVYGVKAGEYIGYDHTHCFKKDTRVAIVAFGYGDGFPLDIKESAKLFVNGASVPIVGKVSMDFLALDIGANRVEVGDYVEILGPNSDLFTYYPHAPHAILVGLKPRALTLEVSHHVE
jgi:alanine racemase